MSRKKRVLATPPERHSRNCTICKHAQREEIEAAFIGWKSPTAIAEEFGLHDRYSVYRHSHALDLFEKRRRNVTAALERIIERAGDVEVTSASIVQAVQVLGKLNARGQIVDRHEVVNISDLFDRMSKDELEAYATTGALPTWFRAAQGATLMDE